MKPSVELTSPTLELKKRLVGRGDGRTSSRAQVVKPVLRHSSFTEKFKKALPEPSLMCVCEVCKNSSSYKRAQNFRSFAPPQLAGRDVVTVSLSCGSSGVRRGT